MPIYDVPRPTDQVKPPKTQITDPDYIHSIVDTRVTPTDSILAFITGSNWTVDYYNQLIGSSEEAKAFDPTQLGVYQNYHKIHRLIIKLQGSLTVDDEASTNGRIAMTGSAILTPMPNLVPIVGDMIIGDIGQGQAGQFTISTIRKLTHLKGTAYEVQLRLDRIVSAALEKQIDSYVSEESYYQRDYLISGQDALLTSEQYHSAKRLEQIQVTLTNSYLQQFMSSDARTLCLPRQSTLTYDPFLMRAVLSIFDPQDAPRVKQMTEYNCDDHRLVDQIDIFTVVINRELSLFPLVFSQFSVLPTDQLAPSVYQNSVRYSIIPQIIFPRVNQLGVDNDPTLIDWAVNYTPDLTRTADMQSPVYGGAQTVQDPPPPVYNVPGDIGMDIPTIGNDSYIFSPAFYAQNWMDCSGFERLVGQLVRREAINASDLYPYCDAYNRWGRLERFYLAPFLIILIRSVLRSRA